MFSIPQSDLVVLQGCDPSNYAKVNKKRKCPVPDCKEKLTSVNTYTCKHCSKDVCLKHRLATDHQCIPSGKLNSKATDAHNLFTATLLCVTLKIVPMLIAKRTPFHVCTSVDVPVLLSPGKVGWNVVIFCWSKTSLTFNALTFCTASRRQGPSGSASSAISRLLSIGNARQQSRQANEPATGRQGLLSTASSAWGQFAESFPNVLAPARKQSSSAPEKSHSSRTLTQRQQQQVRDPVTPFTGVSDNFFAP